MADTKKTSILEQLMGAAVGGGLALALYYAYDFTAPVITAWLVPPSQQQGTPQNAIASNDVSEDDVRRIATQTRKIAVTAGQQSVYAQTSVRAEQRHVPVVRPSSSSSTPSSDSSAEERDSIWEQEWTERVSSVQSQHSSARSFQSSAVSVLAEVTQAPSLPSSGLGLWLLVGSAGAYAGSVFTKKKRK